MSTPTQRVDEFVAAAQERVAAMDASDIEANFAPPYEASPLNNLRAGIMAVKAGLATESWETVAEGIVILQQLEARVR